MARWAVFDIDGTLLPGASIESRFLTNFRKQGTMPYRNILLFFLREFVAALQGKGENATKSNKMYLKGIPAAPVTEYAKTFVKRYIVPLLSKEGLSAVEQYRSRGFKIMLLSGSLNFLVRPLEEVFRPDHIVCSELEIGNGRFTGTISGLHPYALRKKQIVKELGEKLEIDLKRSAVFANDSADVHHMELFGEAVAVNPSPELAGIAQQRGWKTVKWL